MEVLVMERDLINQLERAHEEFLVKLRDLEKFYSDATVNSTVKHFILTFIRNFEEVEDPFVVLRNILESGVYTMDVGSYITEKFDSSCTHRLEDRRMLTFSFLDSYDSNALIIKHDDTLKIHEIEYDSSSLL